jgi:predicted esterase
LGTNNQHVNFTPFAASKGATEKIILSGFSQGAMLLLFLGFAKKYLEYGVLALIMPLLQQQQLEQF